MVTKTETYEYETENDLIYISWNSTITLSYLGWVLFIRLHI